MRGDQSNLLKPSFCMSTPLPRLAHSTSFFALPPPPSHFSLSLSPWPHSSCVFSLSSSLSFSLPISLPLSFSLFFCLSFAFSLSFSLPFSLSIFLTLSFSIRFCCLSLFFSFFFNPALSLSSIYRSMIETTYPSDHPSVCLSVYLCVDYVCMTARMYLPLSTSCNNSSPDCLDLSLSYPLS